MRLRLTDAETTRQRRIEDRAAEFAANPLRDGVRARLDTDERFTYLVLGATVVRQAAENDAKSAPRNPVLHTVGGVDVDPFDAVDRRETEVVARVCADFLADDAGWIDVDDADIDTTMLQEFDDAGYEAQQWLAEHADAIQHRDLPEPVTGDTDE